MSARRIKIAVVQALDGHLTCAGPDDFSKCDHDTAMSAALSLHMGKGHLPAAVYWVEAELPALPSVPELLARAEAGEFPKSFVDEMDSR